MKTKAIIEVGRENGFPRVCQKSTLISKNSFSCRRSVQFTELDTSLYQYVAPNPEVSVEDTRRDEVHHEDFLEAVAVDFELQKQNFGSIDPTITERKELTAVNWQSKFERVCSPVLDSAELHNVMDVFNDAERRDDPDMPQLLADDSDDSRRSSCDYQTINVSDFSIFDMIVAGGAFAGNDLNSEIDWRNFYTDYQCAESTMLLDMCEQYMPLRFLEDTVEKSNTQDLKSSEETFGVLDARGLNLAMDQLKPRDQETDANLNSCSNQLECFDPDEIIEYLSDASNYWCPTPKQICKKKSITLVLDLDETLIHSTMDYCENADFTFPVSIKLKEHIVYVKRRPYLQTFLERVAELFKVVVFTASESIYAKELLHILDPDGKLIGQRFYRESCTFSDGYYTKDLTVIGVELAKVAIIDNSPQVFRLQVNNGIPIKSWFDDPSDRALISLLPFLESLVEVDDVRPMIANRYGNSV